MPRFGSLSVQNLADDDAGDLGSAQNLAHDGDARVQPRRTEVPIQVVAGSVRTAPGSARPGRDRGSVHRSRHGVSKPLGKSVDSTYLDGRFSLGTVNRAQCCATSRPGGSFV
jgi:hypothetical protein